MVCLTVICGADFRVYEGGIELPRIFIGASEAVRTILQVAEALSHYTQINLGTALYNLGLSA